MFDHLGGGRLAIGATDPNAKGHLWGKKIVFTDEMGCFLDQRMTGGKARRWDAVGKITGVEFTDGLKDISLFIERCLGEFIIKKGTRTQFFGDSAGGFSVAETGDGWGFHWVIFKEVMVNIVNP